MPAAGGPRRDVERSPSGWVDISRPLTGDTPVWPGDLPFRRDEAISAGFTVSSLATSCHVGTHLEGARHVVATAPGVEALAVERLVGPAEVVAPRAEAGLVSPSGFPSGWTPRVPRLLLRTDSHPVGRPIGSGFTAVAAETVAWLAERGVDLLGVDTPSMDPLESAELPAHRALAARGMVWVEGLDLSHVAPGFYLLVVLPLPLVGAEASPVRAVLGLWE